MPDGSENIGGIDVSVGLDYSDVASDFATIQDQAKGAGESIAESFNSGAGGVTTFDDAVQSASASISGCTQETLDQIAALQAAGEAEDAAAAKAKEEAAAQQEAAKAAKESAAQHSELLHTLLEFAGVSIGVEALREFVAGSIEAANSAERATIAIGSLRDDIDGARERMEELHTTAETLGVSFEDLAHVEQRFAAFGLSVEQSKDAMHAAIEAAAALNTSVGDVANAIERMASSGMAGQRQLTSLGLSTDQLAKVMGVAADQVASVFREMDQSGRLAVLEAALLKFDGTQEKVAESFAGQWAVTKEEFAHHMEDIGTAIEVGIMKWESWFGGFDRGMQRIARFMGDSKGFEDAIKHWGDPLAEDAKQISELSAEITKFGGAIPASLKSGFESGAISVGDYVAELKHLESRFETTSRAAQLHKDIQDAMAAAMGKSGESATELAAAHDRLRMAQFADLDAFHAMTLELQKQAIAAQGAGTEGFAIAAAEAEKLAQAEERLADLQDKISNLRGGGVPLMGNAADDLATLNREAMALGPTIDRLNQMAAMGAGEWRSYGVQSATAMKEAAAAAAAESKALATAQQEAKDLAKMPEEASREFAGLSSEILRSLANTKNLGQAFSAIGHDIENVLLNVLGKALEKFIAEQIANAALSKAINASIAIAEVQNAAGRAGSAGFASVMEALPFPLNVAAAPGVAAAAVTGTEAAGSPALAGFAEGGFVGPAGGFVHPGEYVTPAASVSRGEYGPPGTSSSGGGGIHVGDIHVHGLVMGSMDDLVDAVSDGLIKGARRAGADI